MIDISQAKIENIIIHHVGNNSQEEGCHFSQMEADPSEHLKALLIEHYLLPLTEADEALIFYHESDLALNAMAQFSKGVFEDPSAFKAQSEKIAKHLYSVSTHPNIVGGEFIVILFSGLMLNQQESLALAVLKVESKDDYLDIRNENGTLQLIEKEGIALSEIQKGALIFSAENHLLVIDIFKKRTKYWMDDFLKVAPKQTEKASLKASRDILRGLSTKIEAPADYLEFNHNLSAYLDDAESIEMEDLQHLSSQYIGREAVDEVFDRVQNRTGFDMEEGFSVPADQFKREAKSIMQKTRIMQGVNLVVTDRDTYLNKIQLEEREGGIRAIIDIDLYSREEE